MASSNEAIHGNQFTVGSTAARGSSNYIHSCNLVWYAKRGEPLYVSQRRRDNTELGRELEKDANLGDTETC
jgi:hypothetical protein